MQLPVTSATEHFGAGLLTKDFWGWNNFLHSHLSYKEIKFMVKTKDRKGKKVATANLLWA